MIHNYMGKNWTIYLMSWQGGDWNKSESEAVCFNCRSTEGDSKFWNDKPVRHDLDVGGQWEFYGCLSFFTRYLIQRQWAKDTLSILPDWCSLVVQLKNLFRLMRLVNAKSTFICLYVFRKCIITLRVVVDRDPTLEPMGGTQCRHTFTSSFSPRGSGERPDHLRACLGR